MQVEGEAAAAVARLELLHKQATALLDGDGAEDEAAATPLEGREPAKPVMTIAGTGLRKILIAWQDLHEQEEADRVALEDGLQNALESLLKDGKVQSSSKLLPKLKALPELSDLVNFGLAEVRQALRTYREHKEAAAKEAAENEQAATKEALG